MDPVIVAGGLAVAFALVALLLWRRAADLEEKVRELEAKLAERAAAPPKEEVEVASAKPAELLPVERPEERTSEEDDEVDEDELDEDERAEAEEPPEEDEEEEEIAAAEPEATPAAQPAPSKPATDPMRVEALKVVSEAFELARYLDFDAIVEKPSTYRVTIPITAANGEAVRYLEDGMFSCLSQVRIEDDTAVLHIDTGKGPP